MHHTGSWFGSVVLREYGRVALALLDRQAVLDLVALGMVEADAEDIRVGELVDALVELAEDRVEVERGGDLAADLAQQLDLLLAFALGSRQRFGGLGAQPRLGELRPLALLADDAAALQRDRRRRSRSPASSDVRAIRPPGAVPRRQDGEGVGRPPRSTGRRRCARGRGSGSRRSRGWCSRAATRCVHADQSSSRPSSRDWYRVAVRRGSSAPRTRSAARCPRMPSRGALR